MNSPALSVMIIVLWVLIMSSALVWSLALARWNRGLPLIPQAELPRAPWPHSAAIAAGAWVAFLAYGRLLKDLSEDSSLPSQSDLLATLVLSVAIWVSVLIMLLAGHSHPRSAFGFSVHRWREQATFGVVAYIASFLPTFVLMQLLSPWRSEETQHGFLRLLAESPSGWEIALMFITVAVIAPMSEELLFRVALQGWLSDRMGAVAAIPLVALLFSAIHGWRDGLALIPLALILGYLFERRRSYLAVVITHSLFNSVMFVLALISERE